MLNIIICENDKNFRLKTYDIINSYLMNTNIKYFIKTYKKYTDELKKYITKEKDGYTIYILDIQLDDDDSGIDIANDIRKDDFDSIIIIETGFSELLSEAQKQRLAILDYLHKSINYEKNVYELLELSLNVFKLRGSVKFRVDKDDYTLKYSDINMIETDNVERACVVHTLTETYKVKKSLNYFSAQLNSTFYKINRGCIINLNNLKKCDYNNNIIKFNNGFITRGMIASKNVKGLKEHVGCN